MNLCLAVWQQQKRRLSSREQVDSPTWQNWFVYIYLLRELDAFIYPSPFLEVEASRISDCPFLILDTPIDKDTCAVAFSKGSVWGHPINNLIENYQNKEYFRELKNKWFRTECAVQSNLVGEAGRTNVQHFSGLFFFCFVVFPVICLLLLVIETCWYRKRHYRIGKYDTKSEAKNQLDTFELFNY